MRSVTTGELARRFGLKLEGDPELAIGGLATLKSAGAHELTFLANPRYRGQLKYTRAGAVILTPDVAPDCPATALITDNPYLAWTLTARLFHHEPRFEPGVHPQAVVDDLAHIHSSASIAATAVIGRGCRIGANVRIGPGCVLEDHVDIRDDSILTAQVFVGQRVRLGQRVIIHPGVVIGADGFGLVMGSGRWHKVPQLGSVRIGDDCEIGANTTIDRGAIEDTVLEEDVRVDNQVQIAHNVVIGAHTAIAGCTGIAGSTRIGRYCMIAGACGIAGHLEICDGVVVTARSTVLNSITEPGEYGSGIPAQPQRLWQRTLVRLRSLERFAKRLNALEKNNK